ncbi:MAG: FtsQ-type POTRA domain-containing protein [Actinomycetota bacterium]|nr:FtsQ-type POTRA domain-containing protein [Actinomycetota bacterium]
MTLADLTARLPLRGIRRGRAARPTFASPHFRRRALLLAVVGAGLLGGWLWLRDSGLVSVDRVAVTGATGPEAPALRAALRAAAGDMTTLHVDEGALRAAVRAFPIVKSLQVRTDFPHGLRVMVIEHRPVAAVTIEGARVPVAEDATLLRGQPAGASVPTLAIPTANAGGHLTAPRARAAVAILAAAPAVLRPSVTGVNRGVDGLQLTLSNGPLVDFGDAARPRAKWAAIAAVLADPRAAGASYLDVRAPERPVAGRFPGAGMSVTQPQPQVDANLHP